MDYNVNDLQTLMYKLQRLAVSMGFGTKDITIPLQGPSLNYAQITRNVTISETAPVIDPNTIALWFQPSTMKMSKSDTAWRQVFVYDDMFFESSSAVSGSGVASTPIILSRDPVLPMEAVTKAYLDSVMSLITSGRLYVTAPVQSVAALRLVDTTTIVDKQIIYVEDVRTLYAYDLQGVGIDNGIDIIEPASTIGRWFSTTPQLLNGGSF